jgi:hypothetical protein
MTVPRSGLFRVSFRTKHRDYLFIAELADNT